jgi:hypothetical protein
MHSRLGYIFITSCNSPTQAIQGHVGNLVRGNKILTKQQGKERHGKTMQGMESKEMNGK